MGDSPLTSPLVKRIKVLLGLVSLCYGGDLPILDMTDYYHEARQSSFVKELSMGFHEHGGVIVINAGINQEVTTRAFRAIERFFALDERVKKKYDGALIHYQRGYLPLRVEKASGALTGDYKEVYHFGRDNNEYPKEVDIQDSIAPYFRELEHYMTLFQEALAIAMGMPKHFFLSITDGGESLLRGIHYPSHLGIWAEAHSDADLFSIFPKSTLKGLEMQTRGGEWMAVEVPDGGIVINVGDFLERLSDGYFMAAKQRVVAYEKGKDRYALGFFVQPKKGAILTPLTSMTNNTKQELR